MQNQNFDYIPKSSPENFPLFTFLASEKTLSLYETLHLLRNTGGENMSRRLRREEAFVKLILQPTLTKRQRISILKHATKQQILALSEIVLNALSGSFDLTEEEKGILFPYRHGLRRLSQAKENISWKDRRNLMVKHSKALNILMTLVQKHLNDFLP